LAEGIAASIGNRVKPELLASGYTVIALLARIQDAVAAVVEQESGAPSSGGAKVS
jgi:hypothetical protein